MTDPLIAPGAGLPVDADLVRELEEQSHVSWLPLRAENLGGWMLRSSAGASRRGNSVWARGPVDDVPAALTEVERFYKDVGTPPTFQVTPLSQPTDLHAALDAAGYDDTGPTDVCVADLGSLLAADVPAVPTVPAPDDAWLAVLGEVMATFGPLQRDGSLRVLSGLQVPQAYAVHRIDGRPVAAGRATRHGDWVGIYSMATLPAARGRGAARAVLASLARWGAEAGAGRAYLQVEVVSTAARRLYAGLGFRPVYRYSYRHPSSHADGGR